MPSLTRWGFRTRQRLGLASVFVLAGVTVAIPEVRMALATRLNVATQGTNDFRVSAMGPLNNTSYDTSTPTIAAGAGAKFLVVWHGDTNTNSLVDGENEIHGQLLVGNTAPSITAGSTLTRTQGAGTSNATIATMSDAETTAGSLTVTATTVPTGLTISNINNSSGTITADVAAACNASTGDNTVVLTVSAFQGQLSVNPTTGAVPVTNAQPPTSASSTTKPSLDIVVLPGNPLLITMRAKKASLTEVAARLSQQLKIPVQVSPTLKLAQVTVARTKTPLETLVNELAPQVYLDYVLSGGREAYPRCRAIYLQTPDDAAPVGTASVQPHSEAILFEGDTEYSITPNRAQAEAEPPLQVSLLQGRLNVRARQQPLAVVLAEIARQCQISFEMRYEAQNNVDLDFQGVPLTHFPQALPPEVQFYYRINLRTLAAKPLHLLLVKPDPIEK